MSNLRVAVVGTGPAGMYTVGHLLEAEGNPVDSVTVIDRLSTPGGLVRAGVAPDHQKTKQVQLGFERLLRSPRVRCHFNVEVGSDITPAELLSSHHAVVYAVGASGSRNLGIDGETKIGSHPATEFVAWYNGHPDFADLGVDLSTSRVVVVGNGNVALDIARVLTLPVDVLRRTDIADHALAELETSAVEEVVLLARRGPDAAAFTSTELLALTQLRDVDLVVEGELDDRVEPKAYGDRLKLALLREVVKRTPNPRHRRIVLRFLSSPVKILGDDRVTGIRVRRNELRNGRAVPTHDIDDLDAGLVLRSIGYRGQPIKGLPFDNKTSVVPNQQGRVEEGVYVAGWIKRGPSGVIGTNKYDSAETVASLLEDAAKRRLADPTDGFDELLAERVSQIVGIDGWTAIDNHERQQGAREHRPRIKVTDSGRLLELAHTEH